MSDAFARIRERRAERLKARTAPVTGDAAPIQTYEVIYLSRGWAILLLLLWTPIMVGLIILMVLHERELNAIPYSTGMRVAALLLLILSIIVVPFLGPTSRRRWSLFADRIEIRERPFIPLLGRYRRARLPFAEIAVARLGEAVNGMNIFELQARDGARFRLAPRHIGSGKQAQLDHAGFDAFINAMRTTIDRSGVARPPGEELHTVTSGIVGVIILGVATAFLGALGLLGAFIVLSEGEPVGVQLIAFTLPFAVLFGGLFLARWRKWWAGRGAG